MKKPLKTFRHEVARDGLVVGYTTYNREDGFGAELVDGTPLFGSYASRDDAEIAVREASR